MDDTARTDSRVLIQNRTGENGDSFSNPAAGQNVGAAVNRATGGDGHRDADRSARVNFDIIGELCRWTDMCQRANALWSGNVWRAEEANDLRKRGMHIIHLNRRAILRFKATRHNDRGGTAAQQSM